jgi:DNA 3'-phosphatase
MSKALAILSLIFTTIPKANAGDISIDCGSTFTGRRQIIGSYSTGTEKIKVAFFDLNDTINRSKSGQLLPKTIDDVELIEHIDTAMLELQKSGFMIAIVSNQGGVPEFVSMADTDAMMRHSIELLKNKGVHVHYYDFATTKGAGRKPGTGMAMVLRAVLQSELGANFDIDFDQSIMVGDAGYTKSEVRPDGSQGTDFSNSDRLFAEKLGVRFIHAVDFIKGAKVESSASVPLTAGQKPKKSSQRYFVKISVDELQSKVESAKAIIADEDDGFMYYQYRELSSQISKDLKKLNFDFENLSEKSGEFSNSDFVGYHELENGLSFLGIMAGGDWETPVFFIIYWDGKALRAYIPTDGNPWNTDTHEAYGNDEDADVKNIRKRYRLSKDDEVDVQDVSQEWDKILADIQNRIGPK